MSLYELAVGALEAANHLILMVQIMQILPCATALLLTKFTTAKNIF